VAREITAGEDVVDQFPVWEPGATEKRSGLGPSDFTVTVWRNAIPIALAVTIAETAIPGEYGAFFNLALTGFYLVEIFIHYNGEVWFEVYEVRKPALLGLV